MPQNDNSVSTNSSERQKSQLQLLCLTIDSIYRRLSPGFLNDGCTRQCLVCSR
ncbi:hypothetical protein DPMN_039174 [Dreissena polymorpha]|uniref:Uncharacterized protein n=1 Tax=Dreissena polymorpha TaxID=45954 RepID=A0A9D4MIE8_DREPO|nr:hypothetical protein DPMN_039174 [Dreissena polymorpha]